MGGLSLLGPGTATLPISFLEGTPERVLWPGRGCAVLTLRVFVNEDPPEGEAAHAVRVVQAAAARFPGRVEVAVLPLASEEASALGVSVSPTVVDGDMVLSVGGPISAGRLKRYLEAQLGIPNPAGEPGPEE